jgi:hypothetical protein
MSFDYILQEKRGRVKRQFKSFQRRVRGDFYHHGEHRERFNAECAEQSRDSRDKKIALTPELKERALTPLSKRSDQERGSDDLYRRGEGGSVVIR